MTIAAYCIVQTNDSWRNSWVVVHADNCCYQWHLATLDETVHCVMWRRGREHSNTEEKNLRFSDKVVSTCDLRKISRHARGAIMFPLRRRGTRTSTDTTSHPSCYFLQYSLPYTKVSWNWIPIRQVSSGQDDVTFAFAPNERHMGEQYYRNNIKYTYTAAVYNKKL